MKATALHALLSIAIVGAALVAYDQGVVQPALRVGVVDLAEVYRVKEAAFARALSASGSDEDRLRALIQAREFAQRLPVALEELPRECRCLVILKSALAGPTPNGIDLTALLKKKVDA